MAVTLELAISAIRAGRKNEGRQLLNLLIQQNPNNEPAWLWMSSVVNTDEQRARCLYHVLSINPANPLARRGLQLLGIAVSDSRPVQVPRDSQPIHIPNPSQPPALPATTSPSVPVPAQNPPPAKRRPFLIDPQTITAELPFTPVRTPFPAENEVKPSPAILSLNVDGPDAATPPPVDTQPMPEPKTVQSSPALAAAATLGMPVEAGVDATDELPATGPPPAADTAAPPVTNTVDDPAAHTTQTQKMDVPAPEISVPVPPAAVEEPPPPVPASEKLPSPPPVDAAPTPPPPIPPTPSRPVPAVASPPNPPPPVAPGGGAVPPPMETRPSQPIYVNYPDPNYGYQPNPGMPNPAPFGSNPANGPQLQQPYPQVPPQGPAIHSNATMGMPMPQPQYPQYRPPSEPVPVIQPNGQYGLISFGPPPYGQPMQGMNLHSNQTVLMPAMSEAEARARLEGNHQAIPTASAAAMPLQNGGGWPEPQPWLASMGQAHPAEEFEDEAEEPEMNVLAVIIFGTLSITAMGGLGMLVLLILTAPAV